MSVGTVNAAGAANTSGILRPENPANTTGLEEAKFVSSNGVYTKQPSADFYSKAIKFFENNPRATTFQDGNRTVTQTVVSSENNSTSISSRIRLSVDTKTANETINETKEFMRVDYKGFAIGSLRFGSPFGTEITPIRNVTRIDYSNTNRD